MLYTSVGICVREMMSVRQTRESQTRRMRQGELAQLTDWVGRTEAELEIHASIERHHDHERELAAIAAALEAESD